MNQPRLDNLIRDLVRLLSELRQQHSELVELMRQKLEAIKRADSDLISSITAREQSLATRLLEREGLRRQIVQKILSELKVDRDDPKPIRLIELAEYLAEPRRSQVLVAAAGLREKVEEMDRLRITTMLVTQEMLKHLNEIMQVMTSGGLTDVYGRTGQRQGSAGAHVFEAVG